MPTGRTCRTLFRHYSKLYSDLLYRFRTLIRPYYRGAAGMILVYDVTDEKTFDSIEEWMRCIAENTQECQIIQKVILANKTGWFILKMESTRFVILPRCAGAHNSFGRFA